MHNTNPYTDKLSKWSSHSLIPSMLEGLPKGARILDIGSSSGMLARFCEGRAYYFRGIEPNPVWAEKTRNLYQEIITSSLEQTPDSYLRDNEAIVLGDVLEHLLYPDEQLQRLVNSQRSGCIFIISVPNIANLWIRINLLFGRFDYSDRGILDRTHLHFYNLKTFRQILENNGLKIERILTTPIPLELVNPFFAQNTIGKFIYQLLATLTRVLPTLLGYQFIAKAYKITM